MQETTVKVVDFPISTSRDFQLANENEEAGVTYDLPSPFTRPQELARNTVKSRTLGIHPKSYFGATFQTKPGVGQDAVERNTHTFIFYREKYTQHEFFLKKHDGRNESSIKRK
jgi:hypothetical protein